MLFNSAEFLFVFLPLVVAGFYLLRRINPQLPILWLVGASLWFYAAWDIRFLPVLLFSLFGNYGVAYVIGHAGRTRKALLFAGIAFNLALLGYFKYTNFFLETANVLGADLSWREVVLPIGISFFTFQQVAYLADTYARRQVERSFSRYALFISFFPQLIAGPIVHHQEMMPQFAQNRSPAWQNIAIGLTFLTIGLVKKVVVADTIAVPSSAVFDAVAAGATPTTIEAWIGALSYSLQIYFDFSAYSDMAVGLGRMFGINLPINFASPYKAASIADFWRRWHITLSRFLRDYLYIPLGGNRQGPSRTQVNLFLTMLLGGIWHGAGWTFMLWGGLHGLFLLAHRGWSQTTLSRRAAEVPGWGVLARTLTLLAVIVAWVPFRSADLGTTLAMWSAMFIPTFEQAQLVLSVPYWAAIAAALWIAAIVLPNAYELLSFSNTGLASKGYPATHVPPSTASWSWSFAHATVVGVALAFAILNLWNVSEFIYFQF